LGVRLWSFCWTAVRRCFWTRRLLGRGEAGDLIAPEGPAGAAGLASEELQIGSGDQTRYVERL